MALHPPNTGYDLFDAADYAACLARETNDEQLQKISTDLNAAFADAIIARNQVNYREERLDNYSLSVVIVDKTTFAKEFQDADWTFTYEESYKATDFHAQTGWGQWLTTNEQKPTNNPCGYVSGDDDGEE